MEEFTEELFWYLVLSRGKRLEREAKLLEQERPNTQAQGTNGQGRGTEAGPAKEVSLDELSQMTRSVMFKGSAV